MAPKYGMFIEHTYLDPGKGAPVKAEEAPAAAAAGEERPTDRDSGLNFKARAPRTGKVRAGSSPPLHMWGEWLHVSHWRKEPSQRLNLSHLLT